MAHLLRSSVCNTVVLCFTTIAFTTSILTPPQLMAAGGGNIDIATINFSLKVEKLYEKVRKSIDKGETNKIVGYMFDFKNEVEQYTGNKINIDQYVDQAQKEAKAKGQKIDDKYIKQIKKDFHKEDKKHQHRATWLAKCFELDIPYTTLEADMHFEMNYFPKGDKDIEVPIPIMVGVTVSLCGLFLFFVPVPICQTAGVWLINTGVGILGSDAINRWDQYDRDKKK